MNRSLRRVLVDGVMTTTFILTVIFLPSFVSAAQYVHKEPFFSVTYPDDYVIQQPSFGVTFKAQRPPWGPTLDISVIDLPLGLKLEDTANAWVMGLKTTGIASDIEIVVNEASSLKDGTPAFEAEIEWMFQQTTMVVTLLVSVFKDGKWIYTANHTSGDVDELKKIAYSMTLKPAVVSTARLASSDSAKQVDVVLNFNFVSDHDRKAWAARFKQIAGLLLKKPGLIELRCRSNLLDTSQVRVTMVWESLSQWANFVQNDDPDMKTLMLSDQPSMRYIKTELWGLFQNLPSVINPPK